MVQRIRTGKASFNGRFTSLLAEANSFAEVDDLRAIAKGHELASERLNRDLFLGETLRWQTIVNVFCNSAVNSLLDYTVAQNLITQQLENVTTQESFNELPVSGVIRYAEQMPDEFRIKMEN